MIIDTTTNTTCKSYKTKEDLQNFLKTKYGIEDGYAIILLPSGRFTAICSYHVHGVRPVHCGFIVWDGK